MAADDWSLGIEREELQPDRFQDLGRVSSPEVRPPDGAPEERVAREEHRLFPLQQVTGRAWSVTRSVDGAHADRAEADFLAVFHRLIGRRRRFRLEPEDR